MTSSSHSAQRYSRSTLLHLRANVTASPTARVKRKLWYWGILRSRPARNEEHVTPTTNHEDQDSQPAQLAPRGSALPPELTPRTAHARENIPRHLSTCIATFNARTLRDDWRVQELTRLASDLNITVLAIQEHRRNCAVRSPTSAGWELKLSPASALGQGGIGFLLSPAATRALLDVSFPSARVGHASFALKDLSLIHI